MDSKPNMYMKRLAITSQFDSMLWITQPACDFDSFKSTLLGIMDVFLHFAFAPDKIRGTECVGQVIIFVKRDHSSL